MTAHEVSCVRVSSIEQIDGHSLSAQELAIRQYCETNNCELVQVYSDSGVSAHVDAIRKRPQFRAMLETVSRREAEIVVVHELSGWSRNVSVSLQAFKTLESNSVTLVSLKEHIDRSTAAGRLLPLTTMLGAFNEFYSDALGERMEKATSQRLLKNLHGGQVPFGWRSVDGQAVKEAAEFAAARQLIVEPFLAGSDYFAIAAEMNTASWLTRSQKLIKQTGKGGRWSANTVRTYLARLFIAGFVGERISGAHEPPCFGGRMGADWQNLASATPRTTP